MSVYLQEPHAKRRANEVVFSENQIYLKFYFRSKEQEQTCCNSFLSLCRRATGPPGHRAAGPPGRRAAGPPGRGGPWAAGLGPRAAGPLGRGPAFSKTPIAFVLLTLTVTSRYVITFVFVSKQTLSKIIKLTPDCGKPTAITWKQKLSVIDQFLSDLAPLSDREYSSNL